MNEWCTLSLTLLLSLSFSLSLSLSHTHRVYPWESLSLDKIRYKLREETEVINIMELLQFQMRNGELKKLLCNSVDKNDSINKFIDVEDALLYIPTIREILNQQGPAWGSHSQCGALSLSHTLNLSHTHSSLTLTLSLSPHSLSSSLTLLLTLTLSFSLSLPLPLRYSDVLFLF